MSSYKHHCDDINGDEFIGDESEKRLLAGSAGCVHCRKLSTSSSIISYDGKISMWPDEIRGEELNGTLPPTVFPQTRIIFNSSDNFEIPLSDQYTNVSFQNGHVQSHEHCHTRVPYNKKKHYGPWKQLLAASVLCTIFMFTEVVGGYLAGSVAVVTDAAHLLSDLVGFLVSMFAIWLGQLPPTKKLSFGYYRAEVLGALLSVAIIWMLAGIFIYVAILRLLRSDFEIDANTMMLVSGLGVVINIIMGLTLHGACNDLPHGHSHNHGHGHGHSHGGVQSSCKSSQESADAPGNINIRAATVHVLGDLVQSLGVFVAAIIIKCYPNAKLADPICTFVFSLLMLLTTLSVLRDTLNVLMEGFPKHLDYAVILNTLHDIDGVESVHNLHIWCLTLDKCAMAVHLAISDSADAAVVLRNALKLIRNKLKIEVVTVQIEKYLTPAMEDCQQCKPLVD